MSKQENSTEVEGSEVQQQETDTTKVKVRFTKVKYFNEDANEVKDVTIIGKLSMPECKKYLKENVEGKNVLISKENVNEEFHVNTVALYALKETA